MLLDRMQTLFSVRLAVFNDCLKRFGIKEGFSSSSLSVRLIACPIPRVTDLNPRTQHLADAGTALITYLDITPQEPFSERFEADMKPRAVFGFVLVLAAIKLDQRPDVWAAVLE